jgi:hypothetical protein
MMLSSRGRVGEVVLSVHISSIRQQKLDFKRRSGCDKRRKLGTGSLLEVMVVLSGSSSLKLARLTLIDPISEILPWAAVTQIGL